MSIGASASAFLHTVDWSRLLASPASIQMEVMQLLISEWKQRKLTPPLWRMAENPSILYCVNQAWKKWQKANSQAWKSVRKIPQEGSLVSHAWVKAKWFLQRCRSYCFDHCPNQTWVDGDRGSSSDPTVSASLWKRTTESCTQVAGARILSPATASLAPTLHTSTCPGSYLCPSIALPLRTPQWLHST